MNIDNIIEESRQIFESVRGYRRVIHQNPELSFEEFQTQQFVCDTLSKEGIEYKKIAGTGVLARIDGRGVVTEDVVVLRADMDALAIIEDSGCSFASTNGAMHGCGHDMHTASLLGVLTLLNRRKDEFTGTVLAIFQPAEEKNPGGASIVLGEGTLDSVKPIVVIGQHVSPEIPCGAIGLRAGQFMAATDEVRIAVFGKGGHGAMPHTTIDPIVITAALVSSLQSIVSRSANPIHPMLLTLGKIYSEGGGTNIIPECVRLEGTLRSMNEPERNKAKRRIQEIADGIASAYGANIEVNISHGFPSVINDEGITRYAEQLFGDILGAKNVIPLDMRMTGEDFGFYTQRFPSLFYRLGVGYADRENFNLHSAKFNPNEDALIYGVAAMSLLALKFRSGEYIGR